MSIIKNRRYEIWWVYEHQYNSYKGVDELKQRPVLVWENCQPSFQREIFCFYCSTKINKINPNCCVKISAAKNRSLREDTYVWVTKPILVLRRDIIKDPISGIPLHARVVDPEEKAKIKTKIDDIWGSVLCEDKINKLQQKLVEYNQTIASQKEYIEKLENIIKNKQ